MRRLFHAAAISSRDEPSEEPSPGERAGAAGRGLQIAGAGTALLLSGVSLIGSLSSGCRPKAESTLRLPSTAPAQTSASCQSCHPQPFAAWQGTDHALANRPVAASLDGAAFASPQVLVVNGTPFQFRWDAKGPALQIGGELKGEVFRPDFVLGHKPLQQFVVPMSGERWQPVDLAWDPARAQWFNVFGDETRHVGEWGHWTGRGMNWNSMCAHCHMTGFRKNYDPTSDAYRSTWVEHGVGCIQCHGPMPAGHDRQPATLARAVVRTAGQSTRQRARAMDTCAYCHARNEALTAEFPPGDNYHDHFRITLPTQPGVFYPDGQQRDEDFNWTSVLLSRMSHAGVTCMDCHDPHSTKLILPVQGNLLCLQCHVAPGREMPGTKIHAPVIDPTAHSHHQEASTGNQCVTCHMPTTTYMGRAPRHDHGWLKPDPLLTRELGIPNACNRCHADRTTEWAIAASDQWYGAKLESRQRARARAVAAAQREPEAAFATVLAALAVEDIPAWRATFLQLLAPTGTQPQVAAVAQRALGDPSPLVRGAAVQALAGNVALRPALRPMLADPVRVVRLDAAWALADELPVESAEFRELRGYLEFTADQPSGQLRLGQFFANTGRPAEADRAMSRAAEWDPFSPGILENRAILLQQRGRLSEAAAAWTRAAELQPQNGEAPFHAALVYAEAGDLRMAESALRIAVTRTPRLHRAWYNLGLLLAQQERLAESAEALRRAAALAPTVADYPYALGTVLLRQGDAPGARRAADQAIAADPAYTAARVLHERAQW